MRFIDRYRRSGRVGFWLTILLAIIIIAFMFGWLEFGEYKDLQAEATQIAAATMTIESLESQYQKAISYMNIGQWESAKSTMELVFEFDPNYKDVQSKLIEIDKQIAILEPTHTPTSLPDATVNFTPSPLPTLLPRTNVSASTANTLAEKELIAYYPFDGNADDESGNNNHGLSIGGIEFTDGVIGSAASFDGMDDYIEIVPQSNVSSIGEFTISVWTHLKGWKTQIDNEPDRQYIFDGHAHSSTVRSDFYREGFTIFYDDVNDGEFHNGIFLYKPNNYHYGTPINPVGRWLFFVFVHTVETDYIYIDGQLVATYVPKDFGDNYSLNMHHNWYIGTFSGNNPNYQSTKTNYSYFGLLDEMRIHNYAISEAEIQELFNLGQ